MNAEDRARQILQQYGLPCDTLSSSLSGSAAPPLPRLLPRLRRPLRRAQRLRAQVLQDLHLQEDEPERPRPKRPKRKPEPAPLAIAHCRLPEEMEYLFVCNDPYDNYSRFRYARRRLIEQIAIARRADFG